MGWLRSAIVCVGILAACDAHAQIACPLPGKLMLRAEMLFGRNIGGRPGVSESRWLQFVARELTPRFPDGLSVIDAAGQWRDSGNGKVVRERSKIVVIVVPDEPSARDKLHAAAEAYKQKFKQQSVAVLTRPICAAF
jgi:hypothetical protein